VALGQAHATRPQVRAAELLEDHDRSGEHTIWGSAHRHGAAAGAGEHILVMLPPPVLPVQEPTR